MAALLLLLLRCLRVALPFGIAPLTETPPFGPGLYIFLRPLRADFSAQATPLELPLLLPLLPVAPPSSSSCSPPPTSACSRRYRGEKAPLRIKRWGEGEGIPRLPRELGRARGAPPDARLLPLSRDLPYTMFDESSSRYPGFFTPSLPPPSSRSREASALSEVSRWQREGGKGGCFPRSRGHPCRARPPS